MKEVEKELIKCSRLPEEEYRPNVNITRRLKNVEFQHLSNSDLLNQFCSVSVA